MQRRSIVCGAVALAIFASSVPAQALTLPEKLDLLVASYPDAIAGHRDNKLIMRDGGPDIVIDDGKAKSHETMVQGGDIEDQLSQLYEAGPCAPKPPKDSDPGRIRSEALMKRLYGESAKAVRAQLAPVDWFGETLMVTKAQGVDRALKAIADDLARDPTLKAYLTPSAGTFNWRKVAGQPNLSVHSFGAAVDINTAYADYWLWAGGKPGKPGAWRNRYPMDIVEIFERHGFIWGGRWYHFDTMHFEYRPEMIAIGRAAGVAACK